MFERDTSAKKLSEKNAEKPLNQATPRSAIRTTKTNKIQASPRFNKSPSGIESLKIQSQRSETINSAAEIESLNT